MTLAQIKQAITGDANFKLSFNQQEDLQGNKTEWKQYFYTDLRVMVVIHNDTFTEIAKAQASGNELTNLGVKATEEISKESGKPYNKFIIVNYTPAEFSL